MRSSTEGKKSFSIVQNLVFTLGLNEILLNIFFPTGNGSKKVLNDLNIYSNRVLYLESFSFHELNLKYFDS